MDVDGGGEVFQAGVQAQRERCGRNDVRRARSNNRCAEQLVGRTVRHELDETDGISGRNRARVRREWETPDPQWSAIPRRLGLPDADARDLGWVKIAPGTSRASNGSGDRPAILSAAISPWCVALWASKDRPLTSPTAKIDATLDRRKSSVTMAPRSTSTPAFSSWRLARLGRRPTAMST
jgi:hypothetical protein